MHQDHYVFGDPENNEVGIYYKPASGVFDNIQTALEMIEVKE